MAHCNIYCQFFFVAFCLIRKLWLTVLLNIWKVHYHCGAFSAIAVSMKKCRWQECSLSCLSAHSFQKGISRTSRKVHKLTEQHQAFNYFFEYNFYVFFIFRTDTTTACDYIPSPSPDGGLQNGTVIAPGGDEGVTGGGVTEMTYPTEQGSVSKGEAQSAVLNDRWVQHVWILIMHQNKHCHAYVDASLAAFSMVLCTQFVRHIGIVKTSRWTLESKLPVCLQP